MRKSVLFLFALMISAYAHSQTTAEVVYNIFAANCNTSGCHNNADKAGGLDLEGTGATLSAKISSMRTNVYDKPSANAYCTSQGYKLIKPGDPYRSTLFRKVHNGLDLTVDRDPSEGDSMSAGLSNYEVEMVRQWILYGSKTTDTAVDTNLVQQYYSGMGIASMPVPPPAPAPSEGKQIHFGPFFIEPNGEREGYWRYDLSNTSPVEVKTVVPLFGTSSHHFILFKMASPSYSSFIPQGFRAAQAHYYEELVTVHQYADSIALPEGTAFAWNTNEVLDFNTHYINYDAWNVLAADVYLNIYTQPAGTAAQVMYTDLVANTSINIPNDGIEHTFTEDIFDATSFDEVFIWGIAGHTHQWGTGYQAFTRNFDGTADDLVYDASYAGGDPMGAFIGYDYKHPPTRYFPYYLPVIPANGLIHVAKYVNLGPGPVGWGPTSEDEMMVLAYFYLNDTTGVPVAASPAVPEKRSPGIYPNPTNGEIFVYPSWLPPGFYNLECYTAAGAPAYRRSFTLPMTEPLRLDGNLPDGFYLWKISDARDQEITSGHLILNTR